MGYFFLHLKDDQPATIGGHEPHAGSTGRLHGTLDFGVHPLQN